MFLALYVFLYIQECMYTSNNTYISDNNMEEMQ